MAINNQYQEIFRAKVKSAIEHANAASSVTHTGVKGQILEILISQLFYPLLPADIGIGTGQIIESYSGQLSNQVDIILYDRSILPPILYDQRLGIFPIEAVLYAIEVKTTLSASELQTAHESAKRLNTKFGYRPGKTDDLGKRTNHKIEKARSVVFALKSDLSGTSLNEAERYLKIYTNDSPYIRAICVAGREYWYEKDNYWIGVKGENGFNEVMAFIGGITNTYRSVSESRGYPSLGEYIIPDVTAFFATKSRDVPSISVTCDSCGLKGEMVPAIGGISLTVNGAISAKDKCPSCGGNMKSDPGVYNFEKGKLVK